jgi:hypothetical protein
MRIDSFINQFQETADPVAHQCRLRFLRAVCPEAIIRHVQAMPGAALEIVVTDHAPQPHAHW